VSTSSLVKDSAIVIRDISVQVVRKPIKNLHLGVYPPDGQVRVSAPEHLTDDNIRLAVISRLSWIRKQREAFARPSPASLSGTWSPARATTSLANATAWK
jgi:predicted metal-dependent hydrolase